MPHMHEKPLPSPSILFDGHTVNEHIKYLAEPVYGWEEDYDPLSVPTSTICLRPIP